jgi:toluene monooxygenase electron transfer component
MESESVTSPADNERVAPGFSVTIRQTGQTFIARPGERLLAAGRRAGVWLPFECGWGSCGTCKATLDSGTVDLVFPEAPSYDQRDVRRKRVLLCQSVATSDITIKPWRVSKEPPAGFATRDDVAELIKVEELGPAISRFTFRLGAPAEYHEGQYAVLQLTEGIRRCYSMEDLSGTDTVSFIAKRYEDGVGSGALFDLTEGSSIAIELPYGGMWAAEGSAPLVLVAGGTGISPILAMVRRLVADQDTRPIRVYYGARSPAELVAWDELRDLVASLPDGELTGAVVDADHTWAGSTGLVTDALTQCAELATDAQVYLAGPPSMVDAVLALLKDHDVEMNRISFDKFG